MWVLKCRMSDVTFGNFYSVPEIFRIPKKFALVKLKYIPELLCELHQH